MDRNRITKFLFGGFALVVLILALVFSLISGGSQESAPVLDSSMPAAPITQETTPTEPGTTPAVVTPEAAPAEQPAH